ncbi:unnamed protein product [Scytosiphon promiscuus]
MQRMGDGLDVSLLFTQMMPFTPSHTRCPRQIHMGCCPGGTHSPECLWPGCRRVANCRKGLDCQHPELARCLCLCVCAFFSNFKSVSVHTTYCTDVRRVTCRK